jgi:hypothetical protein
MRRLQAQRLRAETHIILRWRAPASGCPSGLIRTLSSPKEQRKIIMGFPTIGPEFTFSKHSLRAVIPRFCVEPGDIRHRLDMTNECWADALST